MYLPNVLTNKNQKWTFLHECCFLISYYILIVYRRFYILIFVVWYFYNASGLTRKHCSSRRVRTSSGMCKLWQQKQVYQQIYSETYLLEDVIDQGNVGLLH